MVKELLALAPKVMRHFEENMTMNDLTDLPAEAQAMRAHMISAYSIHIDQGCHSAKLAIPTWAAKDSDSKVFITDQTHAKNFARHCCPHSPLIA